MKKTWLNELAIWQARNAPPLKLPDNVAFAIGNEGDSVQYLVLQWVTNLANATSFYGFAGFIMRKNLTEMCAISQVLRRPSDSFNNDG